MFNRNQISWFLDLEFSFLELLKCFSCLKQQDVFSWLNQCKWEFYILFIVLMYVWCVTYFKSFGQNYFEITYTIESQWHKHSVLSLDYNLLPFMFWFPFSELLLLFLLFTFWGMEAHLAVLSDFCWLYIQSLLLGILCDSIGFEGSNWDWMHERKLH